MSFPGGQNPRVDLYYSGGWHDITGDVLSRDQENSIVIRRGRANWDSGITPDTCELSLRNADGKYSTRNAASPLYGLLGRNTPVRVGIGLPPIAATATGSGTSLVAPSVTAEATGALIVAYAADYQPGALTMPAGFTAQTEQDGNWMAFRCGIKLGVTAGATGTATATYSGTGLAYNATQVHVPGAGNSAATYQSRSVSGADVTMTTATTAAGNVVVAVCTWSDDYEDRQQPPKIQNDRGAGWTLVADTGVCALEIPRTQVWIINAPGSLGQISFTGKRDGDGDAAMQLFVFTAPTARYIPRFTGEISEWPVEWDLRGKDVWTSVAAASVTRRLASNNVDSLRSAAVESFTRRFSTIAYWSLEDAPGATQFASGLDGGLPMTFAPPNGVSTVNPQLGAFIGFQGSDPVPTFNSAGATGPIPPYSVVGTNELAFGCMIYVPAAGTTAGANFFTLDLTGGTMSSAVVEYTNTTTWTFKVRYNNGAADESHAFTPTPALGANSVCWVEMVQSTGTAVTYKMNVITLPTDATAPSVLQISGTLSGSNTLGTALRMRLGLETTTNATLQNNGVAMGHAFVATDTFNVFNTIDPDLGSTSPRALQGWNGQKVSDRIYRLCSDNRLRVAVAHLDTDELMGIQQPATLFADLQDAENTSAGGQIVGALGFNGISYRGRNSKTDQTAQLTLDYAQKQISAPFTPVDDDQRIENDVTVTRVGGSSGRAVQSTGPLNVQPPPTGVGPYRQGYDLSLYSDGQAQEQAQWKVHLGTIDEARWPSVTWDLSVTANASLVTGAMPYLECGDLVHLANLPAWAGTDRADLILEGYTENIGSFRWIITGNFSSASGFRIVKLNDAVLGRLDSAVSSLAAGATSTATTFSVAVRSGGALWTTSAGDFPFDLEVAGERVTVTNITGTSSPQTFAVTRSVNGVVKAQSAGAKVSLADPLYLGL